MNIIRKNLYIINNNCSEYQYGTRHRKEIDTTNCSFENWTNSFLNIKKLVAEESLYNRKYLFVCITVMKSDIFNDVLKIFVTLVLKIFLTRCFSTK